MGLGRMGPDTSPTPLHPSFYYMPTAFLVMLLDRGKAAAQRMRHSTGQFRAGLIAGPENTKGAPEGPLDLRAPLPLPTRSPRWTEQQERVCALWLA
jgi:hypothetical protein